MKKELLYFLILVTVIILGYGSLIAQEQKKTTRVDLIHANNMSFDRSIAPDARRLIGEVKFKHEDATMSCDSAWQFTDSNRFNAYGNVFIRVNDSVSIYGNRLFYNGNTRIAELHGDVRMVDNQMTLTTQQLYYNLQTNTANYINGGKIVDIENTLTSKWGFYYADEKNFFFKDNVKLENPKYTMDSDTLRYNTLTEIAYFFGPTTIVSEENSIFCKNGWYDTRNDIARFSKDAWFTNDEQNLAGDSLFYDRNRGYGNAIKNVFLKDSVQQTFVTGEFAEYFEHEFLAEITRNAVLTIVTGKDSLFLHADTLRSLQDEENSRKLLFAYHKVKFFKTDLQGMADSIVYNMMDSIIYLYKDPVIWSGNHQLSARRIEVKTAGENSVESVTLYDAAFLVSRDEVDTLSFNQIKGKKIIAWFNGNDLYKIDVMGNGEALYYVRNDEQDLVGINKSLSSDITILLEENQVSSIILYTDSDANLFPPALMPQEERFLQNFKWITETRPSKKEDIFVY